MTGRHEITEPRCERGLRADTDALRDRGERNAYCSLMAMLAEALFEQGRYDEAYEATVASEKTAGAGDREAQGAFRSARAKVLARRGELEEAERLAREAIDIVEDNGELDNNAHAWFDLADVLHLAGREDEAADALRTAIGLWDRKGDVVWAARGRDALGSRSAPSA